MRRHHIGFADGLHHIDTSLHHMLRHSNGTCHTMQLLICNLFHYLWSTKRVCIKMSLSQLREAEVAISLHRLLYPLLFPSFMPSTGHAVCFILLSTTTCLLSPFSPSFLPSSFSYSVVFHDSTTVFVCGIVGSCDSSVSGRNFRAVRISDLIFRKVILPENENILCEWVAIGNKSRKTFQTKLFQL